LGELKIKINLTEILLLLLYYKDDNGNRSISGRLKLEKLVFLAMKELEKRGYEIVDSDFGPYRKRPFSLRLYNIIDYLNVDKKALRVIRRDKIEIFQLTDKFQRKIEEEIQKNTNNKKIRPILDVIRSIKRLNILSDDYLLAIAHTKYPEYTTKSEIIERVDRGIDKLFERVSQIISRQDINELLIELKRARSKIASLLGQ